MAAIATKEQERAALEQIKKIIAELGPDSYVGTAFRECFDDAEKNIENDWALSMYDRWQYAEHNLEIEKAKARELEDEKKKLEIDNKRLAEQLERELEWRPYTDGRNVSEADYQRLANTTSTKDLSDEEAANIPKKAMHSIVKFEEIKPGDIFIPDGCAHKLTEAAAKQTYEAQVVVKITAENIENILVSALECCSTYWVGVDNTTPEWKDAPKDLPVSQYCAALLLAGKTVKLYDVEDDSETWILTLKKLIKGIGREISNGFKLSDIEEEADAALQYALFDEVVYG